MRRTRSGSVKEGPTIRERAGQSRARYTRQKPRSQRPQDERQSRANWNRGRTTSSRQRAARAELTCDSGQQVEGRKGRRSPTITRGQVRTGNPCNIERGRGAQQSRSARENRAGIGRPMALRGTPQTPLAGGKGTPSASGSSPAFAPPAHRSDRTARGRGRAFLAGDEGREKARGLRRGQRGERGGIPGARHCAAIASFDALTPGNILTRSRCARARVMVTIFGRSRDRTAKIATTTRRGAKSPPHPLNRPATRPT